MTTKETKNIYFFLLQNKEYILSANTGRHASEAQDGIYEAKSYFPIG